MTQQDSIPQQMKALRLVDFKQNYQLQNDVPVPVPESGEILIRIHAASFCHTDYQVYDGTYKTKLPHTGSHEPVGVIAALGPNVSGGWKVGDHVGAYLFRQPCGSCNDCNWHAATHGGKLSARYCDNKVMGGVLGADGGFAEYMITPADAALKIPDDIPFEQAAPLMCAGATIWSAILEANVQPDGTIAIVGIGGLGILGVQFAKALGYKVVAVHHRDLGSKFETIPEALRPDLFVSHTNPESTQQISDFTGGIGLDAAVVCTDSPPVNDWVLHRLHPRGTCVVLGLPEEGFHFDAFNLVFREIVIKGSLHSSIEDMQKMLTVVSEHKVHSQVSLVPMDDAEALPARVHAHEFSGRPVVVMK